MSRWILLRGLTREARHWGSFPGEFGAVTGAAGVTLLELPGNGREAKVAAPLDVAGMMHFVRAHALAARLAPPYRLFAMSLGGMVATDWAQRYPQEIERLVLVNTSMRPFCAINERLRPGARPGLVRAAMSWSHPDRCERLIHGLTCNRLDTVARDLASWTEIRQSAGVGAANGLRQLWAAARYRADGQAPRCQTLLLSSKEDRLVDPACSARIAARWQAAHEQHPWAGHDLPHDDPAWTSQAVADWLRRVQ